MPWKRPTTAPSCRTKDENMRAAARTHRVNGVSGGGGQAVCRQILNNLVRSRRNPSKSCVFRGTRRTKTGPKRPNPAKSIRSHLRLTHLPSAVLPVVVFWGREVLSTPNFQERKISPKRKFLGRTSRRHPGVIRADIPAQNFGQGGQNLGQTSISVRTSMTRRCGRPRP